MFLQTEQLVEQIKHTDPRSWRWMEEFVNQIPQWVEQADHIGDIPSDFWSSTSVKLLNRLNLPVEYGGVPMTSTALRRVVVFERFGRVCPGLTIGFPGAGLSMPPVLSLGTERQKQKYFGHFLVSDRPIWGAFAITEPQGGSDATNMQTVAVATDDGYKITGSKCFITNGARADVFVVFATIAPEKGRFGIRAFIVGKDTPGFSVDRCENMMGLRASQLAQISFTDCYVAKEDMLGHTGQRGPRVDAFTGAQSAWDYMRPVLSSVINGACYGVLDHAEAALHGDGIETARRTKADMLDKIAYLRARVHSARLLTLRAAWNYDCDHRSSVHASLAKAYSATLAMEIANTLNRLFPVRSVVGGSPIEKFCRDAKAFDILEGTGDMQRLMIARAFDPMHAEMH